jgi:hypothetical protein
MFHGPWHKVVYCCTVLWLGAAVCCKWRLACVNTMRSWLTGMCHVQVMDKNGHLINLADCSQPSPREHLH